jgi:hypothetical protein
LVLRSGMEPLTKLSVITLRFRDRFSQRSNHVHEFEACLDVYTYRGL